MKFALLIMYELRSTYKCIEGLKSKLIDFYNADVFVLCQRQFEDDATRLSLFDTNVKHDELYDKPNPLEYFGEDSNITLPSPHMWNNAGNSQIYINNHKMSKIISQVVNDYDYYILVRSDIQILFDFPSPEVFETLRPGLHAHSCPVFDTFGGIGLAHFVHKNFILDYLTAPYDAIVDKSLRHLINNSLFNQEQFCKFALERKGVFVKKIRGLNYFYTADGVDSYTTWGTPEIHETYNVVYKYRSQVDYAFESYALWKTDFRWIVEDDSIVLSGHVNELLKNNTLLQPVSSSSKPRLLSFLNRNNMGFYLPAKI
jgi:hypothetical protein